MSQVTNQLRSIMYISHGGGPMPLLGDRSHEDMVKTLKQLAEYVDTPSAIIVISAHWETDKVSITSGASPDLIYDYNGFPPESYAIQYPSPGSPELAQQIHSVLVAAGIEAQLDNKRGFDHGVFVPLKIMYPSADIPVVEISLERSLDPQKHIAIGKALQHIQWDNLLLLGSGFSFHNMKAFFAPQLDPENTKNGVFEQWLQETIASDSITEAERVQRLISWSEAPYARFCHPREEHLLPLHVCYGAAELPSKRTFATTVLNKHSSMYLWQTSGI